MPSEPFPSSAASTHLWQVSLSDLASLMGTTISRLSPLRASILTDQLRVLLREQSGERMLVLAAADACTNQANATLAESLIAIALLPQSGDTAAILHVDWCTPSLHGERPTDDQLRLDWVLRAESLAERLWLGLQKEFSRAAIQFVQWATDPQAGARSSLPPDTRSSPAGWAPLLGFSRIGTLDYLTLDRDLESDDLESHWAPRRPRAETTNLFLEPLDHAAPEQVERFASLVRRTYVDSLDCPSLSQFRSVQEIISGYRNAAAFAPDLWFSVLKKDVCDVGAVPIGCLLFARHAESALSSGDATGPDCALELVYMGIAVEHRGQGFGQQIMGLVIEICQQQRALRLIAAVDQDNLPAVAAYRRAGMRSLFRETVWGRCV